MRLLQAVILFLAGLALAQSIEAQTRAAAPAFEVASIKPSPDPGGVTGSCHGIDTKLTNLQKEDAPSLGRCAINHARLSHLVNIAWSIGVMNMIESGPDWIARGDQRFDVVAKAEDPAHTTEAQLLTMLQNLLVARFQMKYHREPVKTDGAAMNVDKNGLKLHETTSEVEDIVFGGGGKAAPGKPVPGQPSALRLRRYSMLKFAQLLSGFGGQGPVVDKTGLTGLYDINLSWDDEAGPTLVNALREQLGLRLEREKVTVSNFVIDSAQPPSAN
jgi:uncharacterized protein (TIGR03435 family)